MRGATGLMVGACVVAAAAVVYLASTRLGERGPDLIAARPPERLPLRPVLEGGTHAGERASPERGGSRIVGSVWRAGRPAVAEVACRRLSGTKTRWRWSGRRGRAGSPPAAERALAEPTATDTSKADGRYALTGLGRGLWLVTARGSDGTRGEQMVEVPGFESVVGLDLDLLVGAHALAGRVLTTDGKPWGTTIAALVPRGDDRDAPPAAESAIDGEGRFSLPGLPRGRWALLIHGEGGFHALALHAFTPTPTPLELRVRIPERTVPMRVLDARTRTPVAGAHVEVGWMSNLLIVRTEATSDAEGRAQLAVAAGADYQVFAAGYGDATGPIEADQAEVTVFLRRSSRVRGRVTRIDTGEPVPGITVRLTGSDGALTDADGRYVLEPVAPETWTLTAIGPGWVSVGLADARPEGWNPLEVIVPDGADVVRDLVVEPAARIEGRVLDAQGAPVPGATVGLWREWLPGSVAWTPPDDVSSDAAGHYALAGVPPGLEFRLHATTGDRDEVASEPLRATAGVTTLDLRLGGGRSVDVRVFSDADGSPLQEAEVRALRSRSGLTVRTDPEGRARLGPLGKGAEVKVQAEDHLPARASAPAEGELVVRLARGVPLSGRVLFPDGSPAPGVRVSANRKGDYSVDDRSTDAEGRFAWDGLAPGPWKLAAYMYGLRMMKAERDVEAGSTDVVLNLMEFVDRDGKETRVHVRVRGGAHDLLSGKVALVRAGRASLGHLDGGQAWIDMPEGDSDKPFAVIVWDANDGLGGKLGPASAGPFPEDRREVEVALPPEMSIVGRVEGLPKGLERGVEIRAHPSLASLVAPKLLRLPLEDLVSISLPDAAVVSTRCEADGSFRLGGLAELSFTLLARLPPGWIQDAGVVAEPGDLATIRVRRGVDALLTVLDPDGRPVKGVKVFVNAGETKGKEERELAEAHDMSSDPATDGEGRVRLRSLRPGAFYGLNVRPEEGRELLPHRTERWAPADTVVRLERALVVEGHVRDRSSRPVHDVRVALWVDGKRKLASTDVEGHFRFDELREGVFALKAARSYEELGIRPGTDALLVPAGTRDVALTLDPGVPLVLLGPKVERSLLRRIIVYAREGAGLREVRGETEWFENGPITLRGFDAGRPYVVWIPPDDDDPRYALVEVADAARGPVDLPFQTGAKLRLRRDGADDPLRATFVRAESDAGLEFYSSGLAKDGSLAGLPPGTWTLKVQVGEDDEWAATVKVGTADMDVVLRLE